MTTVKIGDREFRIGATYAPKRVRTTAVPWRLVEYREVDQTVQSSTRRSTRRWAAMAFAEWAGDEVLP